MKAPLKVDQEMLAALEHALTFPAMTWHAVGADIIRRNAIEQLAKKGVVEIDMDTGQYRLLKV